MMISILMISISFSFIVVGTFAKCLPGTFKSFDAPGQCTNCPAGSFSDIEDSNGCVRCDTGTIAANAGAKSCTACAAGLTTVDGIVCQSCPNNVCATPMPPPPPLRCLHGNGTLTAENVKQRDCDGVRADAFCFVQEPVGFENETLRFCVPASSPLCTGGVDAQATANRLHVRIKFACCRKDDCNLDVASADMARGGDSNQNRTIAMGGGAPPTDVNGDTFSHANAVYASSLFVIVSMLFFVQ